MSETVSLLDRIRALPDDLPEWKRSLVTAALLGEAMRQHGVSRLKVAGLELELAPLAAEAPPSLPAVSAAPLPDVPVNPNVFAHEDDETCACGCPKSRRHDPDGYCLNGCPMAVCQSKGDDPDAAT